MKSLRLLPVLAVLLGSLAGAAAEEPSAAGAAPPTSHADAAGSDPHLAPADPNDDPPSTQAHRFLVNPAPEPHWHPNYSAGWSRGHCTYTSDSWTQSYPTELACCLGAYAGQSSGYCLSQLPSPPTGAPTTAEVEGYYPRWDVPYSEGHCDNARPVPGGPGGRPVYETMLECCERAYGSQMSGVCLSRLPAEEQALVAAAADADGADGGWYADYSINDYSQGVCIDAVPVPNGRKTYESQLDCCKGAYGSQTSGKCLSDLPSPPSSSPIGSGGLDVWYPDYTRTYANGVCINEYPLPNGVVNYPSQMECCNRVYGSQYSQACVKHVTGMVTAEIDVEKTVTDGDGTQTITTRTTVYMSTLELFGLDVPKTPAEKDALIATLEATILALINQGLPSNEIVTEVEILSIGGVTRRKLRWLLDRFLQTEDNTTADSQVEVAFTVTVEENGRPTRDTEAILELIEAVMAEVTVADSYGMSAFVHALKEKARESGSPSLGQLLKNLKAALRGPQGPQAWEEEECDDDSDEEEEVADATRRRALASGKAHDAISANKLRGGEDERSPATNPGTRRRLIRELTTDSAGGGRAEDKKAAMKGREGGNRLRRRRLQSNKYESDRRLQGRKKGWCKANKKKKAVGYYRKQSMSMCMSMSSEDSEESEDSEDMSMSSEDSESSDSSAESMSMSMSSESSAE